MSANAERWLKSLIAVVLGNVLYFSLSPHLPPGARHKPFALDWGIAVDFWFCLCVYGLLDLAKFLRKRKG
jgi:hypothetical protein